MLSNSGMSISSESTGRTYGGESLADRQAKRRQKFMAAGHELFGTVGFRQTTVRLLCKQAELTDRYFYESFGSIEDLLAAVYQQAIDQLQQQVLQAVLAERQAEQMIERGLDAFFRVAECPQTARIVWLEVLGVSSRIDQAYNSALRNFSQLFSQLTLSIYPNLALTAEEIQILAIGAIGAVSQATMAWLLSDYQASRQTMIKSIKPILMGLVLYVQQQSPNLATSRLSNEA